jgi:hypothetical protein
MFNLDQLLALEGQRRSDLLMMDLEHAIEQKSARLGEDSLSEAECIVLAVEALEREVNNGGYSQFFVNNSRVYMPMMVAALRGIGCPVTAEITEKAIKAAGFHGLAIADLVAALDSYHQNYFRRNPPQFVAAASDPEFLELVANADAPQLADDPKWDSRENELSECDHQYYRSGEDVAGKLFEFVRTHRGEFEL